MAEIEEPQAPQSIQARIAALRLEQVGRAPGSPPPSFKTKPSPPTLPQRPQSVDKPPQRSDGTVNGHELGNTPAGPATNGRGKLPPPRPQRDVLPPPVVKKWEGRGGEGQRSSPQLPPRRPSEEKRAPGLPPRRPSEQSLSVSRKQSTDSLSSAASSVSALSLRSPKLNGERLHARLRSPEGESPSLPSLPERRTETELPRMPLRPMRSQPEGLGIVQIEDRPPLPSRPVLPARPTTQSPQQNGVAIGRPKKSALDFGFKNKPSEPPPLPASRPNGVVLGRDKSRERPPLPAGRPNGVTEGSAIQQSAASSDFGLVELTPDELDSRVMHSGKWSLVYCYAPFCKYCKEYEPKYADFATHYDSSQILIAKFDSYTAKMDEQLGVQGWPSTFLYDGRGGEPIKYQWSYEVKWLERFIDEQTGIKPSATPRPLSGHGNGAPPPIPTSSRPDLAQLNRTKPTAAAALAPAAAVCMKCRDFSGPDNHAARFPRQSIPSQDPKWLGPQLCDPFPSHSDKARAIFTWLHHNIDYNVEAFFSGNLKASTPASTIATGLAVCEGYAGLFSAIALAAGLESIVICGHGKGYGFGDINPRGPLPPKNATGHAWNAVKIDGGEWKLIDACWGAGHVQGAGLPYQRKFTPSWFTMSNDEFGVKHYPENPRYFFRDDGRRDIAWDEYLLMGTVAGPKRTVFGEAEKDHGFDPESFTPTEEAVPKLDPAGSPTLRFLWHKICPHYDIVKMHGQPYFFYTKLGSGAVETYCPAKSDGFYWYVDVPRDKLGAPGEEVTVLFVKTFDDGRGTMDGRGVTEDQFWKGVDMLGPGGWRRGYSMGVLARWKVA